MKALHHAGVAHQDLHPGNVMVCGTGAKVIDIMYRGTLRQLPSISRAANLAQDLSDLRIVLRHLIRHSQGVLASDEFAVIAAGTLDFDGIEAAFAAAVAQTDREAEIRL